jgi:hypothetical protein
MTPGEILKEKQDYYIKNVLPILNIDTEFFIAWTPPKGIYENALLQQHYIIRNMLIRIEHCN